MPITCHVVLDSVSPSGKRITTLALEFPTFLTKELNTHRMFSRSYMSSRAVPVQTMLKRVQEQPYVPIHWGKNQKGMQAGKECANSLTLTMPSMGPDDDSWDYTLTREEAWQRASQEAMYWAANFDRAGYHKQVVNRLLEPFSYTVGIVTATEWDNFFTLRLHPAAQPEMQELAKVMKKAMDESIPLRLESGQYHLPFIDSLVDKPEVARYLHSQNPGGMTTGVIMPREYLPYFQKVSVARCARVSYQSNSRPKTFTLEEDLALYDRLHQDGHMGPFEHQASPMNTEGLWHDSPWPDGATHYDRKGQYWSGNFCEWAQFRQLLQPSS